MTHTLQQLEQMPVDQIEQTGKTQLQSLPGDTSTRMTDLFGEVIAYAKDGPDTVNRAALRTRVQAELAELPTDTQETVRPYFDAAIAKGDAWSPSDK